MDSGKFHPHHVMIGRTAYITRLIVRYVTNRHTVPPALDPNLSVTEMGKMCLVIMLLSDTGELSREMHRV